MMAQDLDQTAAAYALGILRGAPRAAIEARLSGDPALQAKIKLWQENFVALDLAAGQNAPPAGLFDLIVGAIDAGAGEELSGTLTRRAGTGVWIEMSPGVTYTVLFDDPAAKRRSMLVRALPGATYESHHHEGHEECLVLEGDLIMGDLKLSAGDFHLAAKGSAHPPATTVSGCLLHISTAL